MRTFFILLFTIMVFAQNVFAGDTFKIIEYTDSNNAEIKKALGIEPEKSEKKVFMQIEDSMIPQSEKEFKAAWHNTPVSQGLTGSCWCFSTTSFLESEIHRISGKDIKLSEMYGIYYEYVEKAAYYIETKGESVFSKGSQPNCAIRIWKKYGIVPLESYPGKESALPYYNHTEMFKEMKACLEAVKTEGKWEAEPALQKIKSIMEKYMKKPPEYVTENGIKYTPKEYLKNVLKINLDDYVDVMSLIALPMNEKGEYPVSDNWWHSKDYLNQPLDKFMSIIKKTVRSGYTLSIVGDITESGFLPEKGAALIPDYDIPVDNINDYARQIRFTNESTSDDHAIHLIGYLEKDGKDWYLMKDSGSSGFCNSKHKGYFFMSEDYVKLKMMNFLVHKDMISLNK